MRNIMKQNSVYKQYYKVFKGHVPAFMTTNIKPLVKVYSKSGN